MCFKITHLPSCCILIDMTNLLGDCWAIDSLAEFVVKEVQLGPLCKVQQSTSMFGEIAIHTSI